MSIKIAIEKHAYAFPSKVLAGNGGEHILNIELTEATDNGVVMEVGAYKSFDNYMAGGDPATYEGKIVDKAAEPKIGFKLRGYSVKVLCFQYFT